MTTVENIKRQLEVATTEYRRCVEELKEFRKGEEGNRLSELKKNLREKEDVDENQRKKWTEEKEDLEKEEKNLEVEKNEWKVQMQKLQNALMETNKTEFDYYQELSLFETSSNSAIGTLINSENAIARYRILFLPEDNIHSPIKSLFTNEEWSIMESNWEKVEKRIADSLPEIDEDVKLLLKKYSKGIKDATINCYVDLNKVEGIICKNPFEDQHSYLFERDYHLRWVQSVYNAFILCLQRSFSPLFDPDASEYAYKSQIINYIWEALFFDVNVIAMMKTGEVENADRKKQLDLSKNLDHLKSTIGNWHHDAVLVIKVGSMFVQVAFGEVIGNAFKRDDKKFNDDKEKMLKAMQLALFNLRKSLPEKAPGLDDLETFGLLVNRKEFLMYSMHWVDGIYLVDQFDGFTIPDTSLDLENLSGIIKIMINFKNRIMKLRAHMEVLYKSNQKFKRGGSRHINDSIVYASPLKGTKS
ncbi:hypothetical protein G9A89_001703 [Geosiphon pyriformis]|nr:hypothetical protein G9A89_001703 [Geosiphon pyriformis]